MDGNVKATKVFRVFISSTFSDFIEERNMLQRQVFPRLEALCRDHGALFQPIDLRWGIRDEASLDHQTLNICLNEVRLCREITLRPSFLILLGDRYGWRPIPSEVPREKFEKSDPSALMRGSYRLDENSDRYCLKPREGRDEDGSVWAEKEKRLRADWEARIGRLRSATEHEIRQGLDAPWEDRQQIFCFHRRLENIPRDESGAAFSDIYPSENGYAEDPASREQLRRLLDFIRERLPEENITSFSADWEARERIMDDFCRAVEDRLERAILRELERIGSIDVRREALKSEAAFSERAGRFFVGQDALIQSITEHTLRGRGLCFVHGGEGKSALCARLGGLLPEGTILRHIGHSAASGDARELLKSIAAQLNDPEDHADLSLRELLKTVRRQLGGRILILDGVDRLPEAASIIEIFRGLRNVIVTARDASLAASLDKDDVFEIHPLSYAERCMLFDTVLRESGKKLTEGQRNILYENLKNNASAAYVKLSAQMACSLRSWDAPNCGATSEELVREYIRALSEKEKHAPLLVARMLSYIACGRNGVTMPSLIGMLLRDDEVFDEFNQGLHHELCRRQIPVSVLSRLYYAITPFLVHTPMLGEDVVTFSFEAFRTVALESCLSEGTVRNAVEFYAEQDRGGTNGVMLSELPYLLLKYRDARELTAWLCRDGHLCRKLRAGLKSELLSDLRAAGDGAAADCLRRIITAHIPDLERCPETAESILKSEAEVLHAYRGADELRAHIGPQKWEMRSALPLPKQDEVIAGVGTNLINCFCSPDGDGYLAVSVTGEAVRVDPAKGIFEQSAGMDDADGSFYHYACVEGSDSILFAGEHRVRRMIAKDFWHRGLKNALWEDVDTGAAEYQAVTVNAPVRIAAVEPNGGQLLIRLDGDGERIPLDFLMRPAKVNCVANSQSGDEIAIAFRSGAAAATTGLYDETSSGGDAMMCCTFYGQDRYIAFASAAGRLYLFTAEGEPLGCVDLSIPGKPEQHCECMQWDERHGLLYVGHRTGMFSVVDPFKMRCLRSFSCGHRMGILCMALSRDGEKLVLGGRGNADSANLTVLRTEGLADASDDPLRQEFGEIFLRAESFGDNWLYQTERKGFVTDKRQLFLVQPQEASLRTEYLASAECFSACAVTGEIYLARQNAVYRFREGNESLLIRVERPITGLAADARGEALAVATQDEVTLWSLAEPEKKGFSLFGKREKGPRKLWSLPTAAERGRSEAPMRFSEGKLLICCEPAYRTFTADETVDGGMRFERKMQARSVLQIIDVNGARTERSIEYEDFADDARMMERRAFLSTGGGILWRVADGRISGGMLRAPSEHAGATMFEGEGEGVRIAEGPVRCVVACGDSLAVAFESGDLRLTDKAGRQTWLYVPSGITAMSASRDGRELFVLGDGVHTDGSPELYVFARTE